MKRKFKPVKAWVGLVDGTLYFSAQKDNYRLEWATVAEVFKSRQECAERFEHVVRVLIIEVPKKKRGAK